MPKCQEITITAGKPALTRSGLRAAYDEVAAEYAGRIANELDGKPLDRALLDEFARLLVDSGRVCDAGCGPGHVARYLRDRGVNVYGVDLSPAMVAEARRLNPEIEFIEGDLNDLPAGPDGVATPATSDGVAASGIAPPDGVASRTATSDRLAAVIAFYSLIHLRPDEVESTLRNIGRRLRHGGLLFIAFHVGTGGLHLDEWWGKSVSIDFTFFEVDQMRQYMETAGYRLEWIMERAPYPDVEHPTRRGYMLGRLIK